MQTVAPIDTQGGYRSPSGGHSFYPTSVFKRVEELDDDNSSSPPPRSLPEATGRTSTSATPLLHRYRVSSLSVQPRRAGGRGGSVSSTLADEPRTAPRLLTRAASATTAQPAPRRTTSSPPALITEVKAEKRVPSPPVMPRSRHPVALSDRAPISLRGGAQDQDGTKTATHSAPVPMTTSQSGTTSSAASTHQHVLPCGDSQCIHSRESIVEFIQMQRELRQCYNALDRHKADLTTLQTRLAEEQLARQRTAETATTEWEAREEQYQEVCARMAADLESQWQHRLDTLAQENAETAALLSERDAEIERLRAALAEQKREGARADAAAQQQIIHNLQRTVREYDAEVNRLEGTVTQVRAQLSAVTQENATVSQRMHQLEAKAAALARTVEPPSRSPHVHDSRGQVDGPATTTTTTTPSKCFGRFRVLTPDASPAARNTSASPSPRRECAAALTYSTPSPAAPSAYVMRGGHAERQTPSSSSTATTAEEDALLRTPPQPRRAVDTEESAWRRAAKESDDRCKELLRALLDKESQFAKVAAERTRFKKLYERSQEEQHITRKGTCSEEG